MTAGMQTEDSDRLREAIRRSLAPLAGREAPSSAGSSGTTHAWGEVAARLNPVIGPRGVDVLFSRALHLTSRTFPWRAPIESKGRAPEPLASFLARLETRDARATAEASQALLASFMGLLETLIGAPLSDRLLAPVWASSPRASRQEDAP